MQHYILIDRQTARFNENPPPTADEWRQKARTLRIRRERLLKQRLREEVNST